MQNFKKKFNSAFPHLFRFSSNVYYFFIRILKGRSRSQIIFTKIYKNKNWSISESLSGPGSNLSNTENLRKELPGILNELKIKSFLDIPCGDFFWMQELDFSFEKYIGADIVKELIESNNELYSNEKRKFITLDLTDGSLPAVDAVFCRECLPHLTNKLIFKSLKQIKLSGSKYLFTSTYTDCYKNVDMHVGGFRRINLQLKPFNLPQPVKLIPDPCFAENSILKDKAVGIWRVSDLPNF